MKYTIRQALCYLLALGLGLGLTTKASAQSNEDKKTTIRVKVEEKKEGKTKVIERSYEVPPLSDADQKAFVDKVLDSLNVNGSGQKQISVTINEDGDEKATRRDRQRIEIRERAEMEREPRELNRNHDTHVFRFDTDELKENMQRFEREFRPRMEVMRKDMEHLGNRIGNVWENDIMNTGTVRALTVYANNPDNGMLNLRFSVPEKGDVKITVTDIHGKEVAQKTIRDFSGEFVGQIELKKNTKGTLFVTVVQKDDGTVRKVVLK